MDRKNIRISLFVSIVAGFVITFVTGLFQTLGTRMGVDVLMRGTPISWSMQVFPRSASILWLGFLTDLAFWSTVALAASIVVLYRHSPHMVAGESTTGQPKT